MTTTRREFIRNAALIGTGVILYPDSGFASIHERSEFLQRIGVCTSVNNSKLFAQAGYSYIEEGVKGYLVPQLDEKAFEEKLKLANKSELPVEACNSFLPGKLKSVGPEAVHKEVLKFTETAFRRAEIAGIDTIVFGSGGSR